MKNRQFTLMEMIIVVAIIAILMSFLLNALNVARQNAYKTKSIANLRQIGTALLMYSYEDEFSSFPDISGPGGFYELRVQLNSPDVLINPITAHLPSSAWSEDVISDYAYAGGLKNDQTYTPDSGIVCDNMNNYTNYGAILYVDGHISGFKEPNWGDKINNNGLRTQAGF